MNTSFKSPIENRKTHPENKYAAPSQNRNFNQSTLHYCKTISISEYFIQYKLYYNYHQYYKYNEAFFTEINSYFLLFLYFLQKLNFFIRKQNESASGNVES